LARRVDGGYLVSGRWEYASGIPYAGWFIGLGVLADGDGEPTSKRINVAVRRGSFTMLDNWGGGQVLGMNASGSHSVVVEETLVPECFVVPNNWHDPTDVVGPTPGVALHGNPMYLGRARALYHTSIAAVQVGTAKACLDEYEELLRSQMTMVPPRVPRFLDPDYQRTHGEAVSRVDAAEALLLAVTDRYTALCHRWADTGEPFGIPDTLRLFGMAQQAGLLAANAVELMFRTAGSSSARSGTRLSRYFRDTAMYQGHQSSQREAYWSRFSRVYLGVTQTVFETPGAGL
jgi:3-hydroxy-9,10-secoandrosta-1,3,5(10)-triene-9,17-dione monooxygenase